MIGPWSMTYIIQTTMRERKGNERKIKDFEDDYNDFDAYYHTTNDRLSTLNLTYFTNYVKASVGTAAHLALPLTETGVLRGMGAAVFLIKIADILAEIRCR